MLGAYGLIGSACARALGAAGFHVIGVGRSTRAAEVSGLDAEWMVQDVTRMSQEDWRRDLAGADVVVNATGALQTGGRDDLHAIHVETVRRLVGALAGSSTRLVQISAAGVSAEAPTDFFRSKAEGDRLVIEGAADWVILRPTLVLSRDAYGGTALLRAAAALPGVLPRMLPHTRIQTVFIDDLAAAVVSAARREVPAGTVADITEPEARSFDDLLAETRRWLGLPPARFRPRVPGWALAIARTVADCLGRMGWRSPLRTNALRALADGIAGDPGTWSRAGGAPCRSLGESFAAMPATAQERAFARLYLVLPVAIGVLSLFWLASGIIALAAPGAAAEVLTSRGMGSGPAMALVLCGAAADLALGFGILWRRAARRAASGMVVISAGYMLGAALLAPDLWLDPLGPIIKVLPQLVLAGLVALALEER